MLGQWYEETSSKFDGRWQVEYLTRLGGFCQPFMSHLLICQEHHLHTQRCGAGSVAGCCAPVDAEPGMQGAAFEAGAVLLEMDTMEPRDDADPAFQALDGELRDRAAELGTRTPGSDELEVVADDVDGIVGDLESLRLGLDDVSGS